MESPGWYPDAEPYEFGGVEQAEAMTARIIAAAVKDARNLFMDTFPISAALSKRERLPRETVRAFPEFIPLKSLCA